MSAPRCSACPRRRRSRAGLELFRAVCEAVQYAHGEAIIHRDLKPSNILVKAEGNVKLLDFGIAKHLESLDASADQTLTGLRLMTPAYAAPEQLRGQRVGIHTDVYSLGVILYELLAQHLPFDLGGRSPAEAVDILLERSPERPSAAARVVLRGRAGGSTAWADLDVLCLTAMCEDPARRYPTVEALIRDVDHYLAGEPLEARAASVGYRMSKFARRHRAAVTATGAALVTLLVLVAFYTTRVTAARDTARVEAARTARVQRFMLNLFSGGDEVAGPADELRVLTLLERGVRDARELDGEPLIQAELYRALGGIYQKLGDFEQADALLNRALDQQHALLGAVHAETAETLVALGLLRVDEARFAEAEDLVRQGLAALEESQPAEHPSIAQATAALGRVLEARGDYDQAIEVTGVAVRAHARHGDQGPEYIEALGQLADGHFYAGHYDTADELNREVLEGTRRLYGEDHPRVADVLINLGASQGSRGNYAEAESLYREALAMLVAFHGPEHYRTASAQTMLGRVLVYQQEFDEGVALLESALVIQERVHGPVHPRVASVLNDLGSAALQQHRLDEAEACFARMLDTYLEIYPEEHSLQGTATSNLASVLIARQEYDRAEALYREAVAIYARTLSPTHLNTGIARIKLGRALLRQERYPEAEVETLAGLEIVESQASPSVSWLSSARQDLIAIYEASGRPELADAQRRAP